MSTNKKTPKIKIAKLITKKYGDKAYEKSILKNL